MSCHVTLTGGGHTPRLLRCLPSVAKQSEEPVGTGFVASTASASMLNDGEIKRCSYINFRFVISRNTLHSQEIDGVCVGKA